MTKKRQTIAEYLKARDAMMAKNAVILAKRAIVTKFKPSTHAKNNTTH